MTNVEIIEDPENRYAWSSITRTFDELGALTEQLYTFDDGTLRFQDYDNGLLRFEEWSDPMDPFDGTSAKAWDRIQVTYDEFGTRASRLEYRDDGVVVFQEYEAGTIRLKQEEDYDPFGGDGARGWSSRETRYDEFGQRETYTQYNDDGTSLYREYDAGTLRLRLEDDYDPLGGTGAKSWENRETAYDENGDRASFLQTNDDGTSVYIEYEAGVARRKLEDDYDPFGGDGAKAWDSRETLYDENGDRASLTQSNDDGTSIYLEYEAGTLRRRLEDDYDPFGGDGARAWSSREVLFDENGDRESFFQSNDDGTTLSMEYEAGTLRRKLEDDYDPFAGNGAKAWTSRETRYDETGQIEARATSFDDFDVTQLFYEGGVRSLQLELDGDGDQPWLLRETFYDAEGQVAGVNTYDTYEDIPPEYGVVDYFL